MYDVIVVGARCAGSPTAMLLARAGHRVLLIDKSTFPSDRLSTHYIQPGGVQDLADWGLLDDVLASGAPKISSFTVYNGDAVVPIPPMDGFAVCPRRHLLDHILVKGAQDAGAELWEGSSVDSVQVEDGVVVGVVGHRRDYSTFEVRAPWVIGAEGHHSLVARTVNAETYRERPALTGGYYSYFSGLDLPGAAVYLSDRGGVLAFPTNNNLVCIAAGGPVSEFPNYRKDIEGHFFWILDGAPGFAARVRAANREERWMGTSDVPNFFRKPYGRGWALVGDAGYMKDPTTGFGITDAFRDARLLAAGLDDVLCGREAAEEALAGYQSRRDAAALPIYELTIAMASGQLAAPFAG